MSEIPDEKVQEYAARMRALLQIPEFNPDSTYPNVFAADGALVINSRVYNAGRQQEDVYFRSVDRMRDQLAGAGIGPEAFSLSSGAANNGSPCMRLDLEALWQYDQKHGGVEGLFAKLGSLQPDLKSQYTEMLATLRVPIQQWKAEHPEAAAAEEQRRTALLAQGTGLPSAGLALPLSLDGTPPIADASDIPSRLDAEHPERSYRNGDFSGIPASVKATARNVAKGVIASLEKRHIDPAKTKEFARFATLDGNPALSVDEAAAGLLAYSARRPSDQTQSKGSQGSGEFSSLIELPGSLDAGRLSAHLDEQPKRDAGVTQSIAEHIASDAFGVSIPGRNMQSAAENGNLNRAIQSSRKSNHLR